MRPRVASSLFPLLTLLCLLRLTGCAEHNADGEIETDTSRTETSALRIVALSPAIGVMLRDLGLGDKVVGRHAFDLALDPAIPVVGDQSGIDYEALLRVHPTHVALQWGSTRETPQRLVSIARERGWRLADFEILTLEQIRRATRELATFVDDEQASQRAEALLVEMDRAWSRRPGLADRAGRTLALYWTNPPGAAGPGSFHQQLLLTLGALPAIEHGAAYISMDGEDLRLLDPDSIVIFSPGAGPEGVERLLAPLRRLQLRAALDGRVAVISHPLCQTPSTAMIGVADDVAEAIARWAPFKATNQIGDGQTEQEKTHEPSIP